ncbi:hypothetical protein Bca52824_036545 [Brassica carinata]|uniref:DUF4283 domain-containing protein n=1 Tax=Brassica carinata TaxID=52824 RepID=A0A8X7S5H1_BRACI|nr:hypothetical protein Bca52824_036545 [Brassica carinata]
MSSTQIQSLRGNSTQEQTEDDDDLVILPNVDNSELIAQFKQSLVGRIFNTERRSVEALLSILPRPNVWDVEGRVRGLDLGNHRFQFDFDSEADLVKLLSKRPCHFNKWAISLERWIPHVGDTFPNKMTFWISVIGIPTHFWMDAIFESLGGSLGKVGPIEARAAKVQLPSGEIVPVKLVYSNLHRFCRHCRLVSHEIESCPQLSEAERKEKSLSVEEGREHAISNRFDAQKMGDNSKSSVPQSSKDRHSGKDTHRDTRDSVWKRIDSRYDPRVDPRSSSRYDHRQEKNFSDRQRAPPTRDSYNKRRYDKSFISSKQREASRRDKMKERDREASLNRKSTRDQPKDAGRNSTAATTALQISASTPPVAPARQSTVSPVHTRERPFRLTLQKRASTDLKLKGKVSEEEEASDEGSSARKSLNFEAPSVPTSAILPIMSDNDPSLKENPKSWYEITLEEEGTMMEETAKAHDPPLISKNLVTAQLPLTERILEEEDWLDEGNEFGDADGNDYEEEDTDLMEEDVLLEVADGSVSVKDAGPEFDSKNKTPRKARESPSGRVTVSSGKKKRSARSPSTIGVTLRQRNLLAGIGSPKPISSSHGLNVSELELF